jgi:glucose/arabinose dehydrogenase
MTMRSIPFHLLCAAALAVTVVGCRAAASAPVPQVPAGFKIEVWADGLDGARSMALGDKGTVFVGTRKGSKVYAIPVRDGRAGTPKPIGNGLNQPNGVAFHDGALYVAEIDRITRYADIESKLDAPPQPQVIRKDLPTETHHGWRYIAFGPDGKLYLPIGAPCNVCEPETFTREGAALQYGSITRMNADGSGWELIARGVRNSVGYDWNPRTKQLWFTDNGRDMLGDDVPSDELNRLTTIGEHFGFPYCHQGDIADPDFGKTHPCKDFTPPIDKLGAHVAALGLHFYTGKQFPAAYRTTALIAEHGSWNRSSKVGYRVVAVTLDGDVVTGEKTLVDGFLDGEQVSGRPVDLLQLPDGSILISDDFGNRIWRLSYKGA